MNKSGKYNKVIAGYHMLMLISVVDNEFSPEEGELMVDYLTDSFPFDVTLDNELEVLSGLPHDEYYSHFIKCMNDFYSDSNEKERNDFLNKAVRMVMADKKITVEENKFLTELYNAWDIEHLED